MMFQDIDPHKFHIEYVKAVPKSEDYLVIVHDNRILFTKGDEAKLPTVYEVSEACLAEIETTSDELFQYLFSIDDKAFYTFCDRQGDLVTNICIETLADSYELVRPGDLRRRKPMWVAYGATVAYRLVAFYDEHRYCGRCGGRCEHSDIERAMVCTKCGYTAYPQISPSVIVLIKNGDKAVLTKYSAAHSSYRNYALVAGYVETGETPEDAVKREVFEEVGLRVKNIRYYKSQPWPLSGALLLGYICDLDGDDTIVREEGELSVAQWVHRNDMPDRSDDISLTSELMEVFRKGS